MPGIAAPPSISADACAKIVSATVKACQAPAAAAPATDAASPNMDAIGASLSALSTAFTYGSLLLAAIAIIAAIGWGYLVRNWAEREARKEAQECVDRMMANWLAEEAPQIIRKHVELLRDTSLGPDDDDVAADEIGKEAG